MTETTFAAPKLEHLRRLLAGSKHIVITTHHKPDADALGSSLGMAAYLRLKGLHVDIITPTDFPNFLFWMKGQENVINFEAKKELATKLVADADLLFCLDFSAISRINDMGPLVEACKAAKVMIDHHMQPEAFAELAFCEDTASATSELVLLLIEALGDINLIDKDMASCLYAGIMTDTGSFRHSNTKPRVHRVVAKLIERGIEVNTIHRKVYEDNTLSRLRFMGYVLNEKLKVMPELHTAYITVTADELKRYNVQTGETEGLVNWALSLEGIRFATIIVDRTEVIKLSFRSVGSFGVDTFSREHFEGGGHRNASGGKSDLTLDQTLTKFLNILPQYQQELARP